MARQPAWFKAGVERQKTNGNGHTESGHRLTQETQLSIYEANLRKRYVPYMSLLLRINGYFADWLITPNDRNPNSYSWWTLRRIKFAIAEFVPNAVKFLRAVTGRRMDGTERVNKHCLGCPNLRRRLPKKNVKPPVGVQKGGVVKGYCIRCGCPDTPFSRVVTIQLVRDGHKRPLKQVIKPGFKANLELAECPAGLWPDSANWVPDYVRETEKGLYDERQQRGDTGGDDVAADDHVSVVTGSAPEGEQGHG